ncbi:hypothetical protein C8J56DRAFT_838481 [Mycena floridula]|nr:hypothetical protein C8J56DRAFT_838481 [Mycena floridula]
MDAQTPLVHELQRRFLVSGEWDRIKTALGTRLNEAGWCDEVFCNARDAALTMEPLSFAVLLKKLQSDAKSSIPLSIRAEIMVMIRQFLEREVEL